jgi:hypothetical protein
MISGCGFPGEWKFSDAGCWLYGMDVCVVRRLFMSCCVGFETTTTTPRHGFFGWLCIVFRYVVSCGFWWRDEVKRAMEMDQRRLDRTGEM